MRVLLGASFCVLAAGAALAAQILVGGEGVPVNYPFCGS